MQDKGWMDGQTGKGLTTGKRQTAGLERQLVFKSPVRSGFLGPGGSNRDRDRLAFFRNPKITGPDR